jgi:hypothetical protein
MRYNIDVYGVFLPTLLLWLVVTYALGTLLSRLAQRTGFYQLVWHRALFDFAMYVCLLGGVVYLSSGLLL